MAHRFTLIPAVHLFLIKNDQILLLRRFNTGYEDGNYSVPAGHLDGNEAATKAMVREAQEETGITLQPEALQLAHVMHRRKPAEERIDFFFTARNWRGDPHIMEPHKCDDLSWFPLNQLPHNTVPYVRSAINNYLHNQIYSGYGWQGEV